MYINNLECQGMEVVKVSCIQDHLASIGQLVAEEAHRPAVVGAGTCSLPAGLIDDSMIECQFIHVQLLNYH